MHITHMLLNAIISRFFIFIKSIIVVDYVNNKIIRNRMNRDHELGECNTEVDLVSQAAILSNIQVFVKLHKSCWKADRIR